MSRADVWGTFLNRCFGTSCSVSLRSVGTVFWGIFEAVFRDIVILIPSGGGWVGGLGEPEQTTEGICVLTECLAMGKQIDFEFQRVRVRSAMQMILERNRKHTQVASPKIPNQNRSSQNRVSSKRNENETPRLHSQNTRVSARTP